MHKIRTLTDLRKLLQLERFDRKNTKVYIKLPTGVASALTGVELDVDGTDAGKMAVYFTVAAQEELSK